MNKNMYFIKKINNINNNLFCFNKEIYILNINKSLKNFKIILNYISNLLNFHIFLTFKIL